MYVYRLRSGEVTRNSILAPIVAISMLSKLRERLKNTPISSVSSGETEIEGRREGDPEEYFTRDDSVERYASRLDSQGLFPQEQKTVRRYFTKTGASVLDVGCGAGRVSHLLEKRGFDVTGIDPSEPLVERARSRFPEIDFRVGDIADSDIPSEEFDYVVFSYYGLDYLFPGSRRLQALREIYRVMKPGGFFLLSTHNGWYPFAGLIVGDGSDFKETYLSKKNRSRLLSPYRLERVTDGTIEIYVSNPIRQWTQLWNCGFTPTAVVGKRDDALRLFERNLHYVAKK